MKALQNTLESAALCRAVKRLYSGRSGASHNFSTATQTNSTGQSGSRPWLKVSSSSFCPRIQGIQGGTVFWWNLCFCGVQGMKNIFLQLKKTNNNCWLILYIQSWQKLPKDPLLLQLGVEYLQSLQCSESKCDWKETEDFHWWQTLSVTWPWCPLWCPPAATPASRPINNHTASASSATNNVDYLQYWFNIHPTLTNLLKLG